MKNILQAWLARFLLASGLAGSPLGLLAQGNIEATPSFGLAPGSNGNYTLNVALNLNTPDAEVRTELYAGATFQGNYASTRAVNKYTAAVPVPGQGLNQGIIRSFSLNTTATTFTAEFLYTIVTDATLRNYPKVTDRMGRINFTPSAADRLNPGSNGGFLQRLMILSTEYKPLLKDIPRGWRQVSSVVSIAATTGSGTITNFQQNGVLEIGYEDWELETGEEQTLSLFRWNESTLVWEKLACPTANTSLNQVSVDVNRTGTYVLLSMMNVNDEASFVKSGQSQIHVAASSLRTSALIDTLGVVRARGGTEIILSEGFLAYQGSQFDTELTGTYCVSPTGSASTARETFAESGPAPQTSVAPQPGLSPAELAASHLGDNRAAVVHPNPVGAEFTLTYRVRAANEGPVGVPGALSGPQPVTIRLYDMRGRLKATVLAGAPKEPGIHHQVVPSSTLRPALYVLELQVGNEPKRTLKVIKQ